MVADPHGVGDRGQGRVHRGRRDEEAGVDDIEVVELVGLASAVQHRALRVVAEPHRAALVGRAVERQQASRTGSGAARSGGRGRRSRPATPRSVFTSRSWPSRLLIACSRAMMRPSGRQPHAVVRAAAGPRRSPASTASARPAAPDSASGTRAGGSQSETCPSSVWPDMYSSSWMWPIGKS